jgi:DNA polymerase-3 subunit epsilon
MRQIFLDTETTGLEPRQGHRIIEVAAVEVVNRRVTGRDFHRYLNPDRDIDAGAQAVHGITLEFLADKPRFGDVAEDFLAFVAGAELVIHNAPFDLGFLNAELARCEREAMLSHCAGLIDTLKLARELFPGQKAGLDALCKRFEIDNRARNLHGALLDARLLASVYLAMTRGQDSLVMERGDAARRAARAPRAARAAPRVLRADADELLAHQAIVDGLPECVPWP